MSEKLLNNLNNLAESLMNNVPNDIKDMSKVFVNEVAKLVQAELVEADKKIKEAETRLKAVEDRLGKGKDNNKEELFILKSYGTLNGTWPTLFKAADPEKPLYCIRFKKHPEQPVVCGAHCAGFKMLKDNNIEICTGSVRVVKQCGG